MDIRLAFIIFTLTITFVGSFIAFVNERKKSGKYLALLFVLNLITLTLYLFINKEKYVEDDTNKETIIESDTTSVPTALDVYNGKTKLQITTIMEGDSVIKSDTIVVFKK